MGHQKVARIRRLDWWVKANNMWSRTTSGGEWWQHDCWLTVRTHLRNKQTNARENITRTLAKRKAGYFFVAYSVYMNIIKKSKVGSKINKERHFYGLFFFDVRDFRNRW